MYFLKLEEGTHLLWKEGKFLRMNISKHNYLWSFHFLLKQWLKADFCEAAYFSNAEPWFQGESSTVDPSQINLHRLTCRITWFKCDYLVVLCLRKHREEIITKRALGMIYTRLTTLIRFCTNYSWGVIISVWNSFSRLLIIFIKVIVLVFCLLF